MENYSDIKQKQIISNNLKDLIKKSNLDQKQIAIELEVNPPTFNQWVMGKAIPQVFMLKKIAEYFNVKITAIINSDEEPDQVTKSGLPSAYEKKYIQLEEDRKKIIHKAIEKEYRKQVASLKEIEQYAKLKEVTTVDEAKTILSHAAAFGGHATAEELISMANTVLQYSKK